MPMFSSIVDAIPEPANPVDSISRAVNLRSLIDQRKQARELGALTIQQHKQAIADDQASRAVFAGGGTDEEKVQKLKAVNPAAAYKLEGDLRANQKAARESDLAKIKLDHGKAEELGSIAGSMVDQDSYVRGIGSAVSKGYMPAEEATQFLGQPYGPEVAARVKQWQSQAMSAKEQLAQHIADQKAAMDAEEHQAKLPGQKAESAIKSAEAEQIARPVVDANGQPVLDAQGKPKTQGMSDKDRAQIDARLQEVAKLNTPAELAAVASDATKTPAQREVANAALKRLNEYQKNGRQVTNFTAAPALSPEAIKLLADSVATGGALPNLGRNAGGAIAQIYNTAAAQHPGTDINSAKAGYRADSGSLAALQKNRDAVSAFENTALKNLDQFLSTAKGVYDSGSPLLNSPIRMVTEKMAGSDNMTAFNVARQVAVTEIAKVLSNPGMGGQLSDSARHEVQGLIGKDATLKQIYRAAEILKGDMKNRADSMDAQIGEIRSRIGKGGNGGNPPAAAAATHRFNPATGKIEEIK